MRPLVIRVVRGNSMLPALKPGSVVFASSIKKYKPGSIVVAKLATKDVIKRVKKIKNDKVWLASDNQYEIADSRYFGPVNKRQIIGTKL